MKIRPVGAVMVHATDGQTDMTKLKVASQNFATSLKNKYYNNVDCVLLSCGQ
jgi:hypothetical protein